MLYVSPHWFYDPGSIRNCRRAKEIFVFCRSGTCCNGYSACPVSTRGSGYVGHGTVGVCLCGSDYGVGKTVEVVIVLFQSGSLPYPSKSIMSLRISKV